MRPDGVFPWEVTIDTTKAALLRFMEALLFADVSVVSATIDGLPSEWALGRGKSAKVVVNCDSDSLSVFIRRAQPIYMRKPRRWFGAEHPGDGMEFTGGALVAKKKRW